MITPDGITSTAPLGERVIYHHDREGVIVTASRFMVGPSVYLVASIDSVALARSKQPLARVGFFGSIALAVLLLFMLKSLSAAVTCLIVGFVVAFVMLVRKPWTVVLIMNGQDVRPFASRDEALVREIVGAVNEAIALRVSGLNAPGGISLSSPPGKPRRSVGEWVYLGCGWSFVVAVFGPLILLPLYAWQEENLDRWFGSRAKTQVTASQLVAEIPEGRDRSREAEQAREKWESRQVEVSGVVVRVIEEGGVVVCLAEKDGGPELVCCECRSQGPAEVGRYATVRGRVWLGRGSRPVRLQNALVVQAR